MKILVSNDDGILSNGIRALIEALSPCHDVYVIAPDRERSAAGHSLTLHTPLRVEEVESKYGAKRCWMTTGTPGDCVKLAINAILDKDELPDLVISGINPRPQSWRRYTLLWNCKLCYGRCYDGLSEYCNFSCKPPE